MTDGGWDERRHLPIFCRVLILLHTVLGVKGKGTAPKSPRPNIARITLSQVCPALVVASLDPTLNRKC